MGDWLPFRGTSQASSHLWSQGTLSRCLPTTLEDPFDVFEGEEKNAVYGGFKWGFDFRLKTTSSCVYVTPGDYNFIWYVTPMNEPTEEFKAIVRAYETGDVGFGGSIGTGDQAARRWLTWIGCPVVLPKLRNRNAALIASRPALTSATVGAGARGIMTASKRIVLIVASLASAGVAAVLAGSLFDERPCLGGAPGERWSPGGRGFFGD